MRERRWSYCTGLVGGVSMRRHDGRKDDTSREGGWSDEYTAARPATSLLDLVVTVADLACTSMQQPTTRDGETVPIATETATTNAGCRTDVLNVPGRRCAVTQDQAPRWILWR